MAKYKAVLWDLDGTILYTLEDLWASTNRTLSHFGLPACTLEELERAVGNGARRQIAAFFPDGEENPRFEEAMAFYRADYPVHCADQARPYDGIPEVLAALKAAGVKMAIVSNKPQNATALLWQAHFADTLEFGMGEQAGVPRKPDGAMPLLALEKLGVSPKEAVYVGDSEVDIATAKNAGMDCISVSWGYRPLSVLKKAGAQVICAEPRELLPQILGD